MKKIKRIYYTVKYLYDLMYWEGCEKLSFYEWVYGRRIGFKTAYDLSKLIVDK